MLVWRVVAVLGLTLTPLLAQDAARSAAPAATSQPASGDGPRTQRRPTEDPILRELLREKEQMPAPIQPKRIGADANTPIQLQPAAVVGDGTLLLEGLSIAARPGRFVREGDQARFVFHAGNEQTLRYDMPINPSSLLELMEREAERGVTEFEISAEIKLYRGQNYLDLRKVVRRVSNNNVSP